MTGIAIAAAAALGALARYGLEQVFPASADGTHYAGTAAVNLSGALAVGVVMGALGPRLVAHPELRGLLTVGFLSSYTTFSALAYQAVNLGERGAAWTAAAYVLGTVGGGIALAYLGLRVGRAI